MNYDKIVQAVIEKHKDSPIDMMGIGDATGEYNYLSSSKDSYIRTVRDIDNLFKNSRSNTNILEIGSFLGPVSISLKKIGYNVCALDIPEFYRSSSLRTLYEKNDIPFTGLNLREYRLPYESNSFDVVIIYEVIEHLNFNPLPVLKEINRVIKKDGYIYIGMPNQSHIYKRVKLLLGESIHNSIDDFFSQLDRNSNMIVGLHWREYTIAETVRMIEKMGFEIAKKYYFAAKKKKKTNALKALLRTLAYIIPSFRPYQVVIGKKVSEPSYNFWLTDSNT
jgi:2-polyprenyl-3-methyl-5-hydroxy-6-metoxy-1,4-benzoquinol methylase